MQIDPAVARTDLELIELHARTLHTHDAAGRLLTINDGGRKPAARLFLGWTARDAIWRVRDDLPADLVARLGELIAAEPSWGELDRPPACLAAVRAALAEHAPVAEGDEGGPAFCFPEVIAEPAGVVAVTAANAEVLRRWLPAWLPDVATGLPIRAAMVDGAAVAICACARLPGEATEAGLETHPAFRGRGHAARATAAWARAVRERGILPLYSTGFSNAASQRVAAKLGLRQYGASISLG
jgi:GNAT superfamily N-acetyltransferase